MNWLDVLVTSQPVSSHLSVMLPLARATQSLGSTVALATPPKLAPMLGAVGIRHIPVGIDWTRDPAMLSELGTAISQGDNAMFCDALFGAAGGLAAAQAARELSEVLREAKPRLV